MNDLLLKDMMPIVLDFPANEPVRILPVADLHIGSKEFNHKAWERFKETIGDRKLILAGDMFDNGTRSAPGAAVYEQAMSIGEQKEWLYKELQEFAENGQILAGTSGNHEKRSKRDTDCDILYDVFARWKIEDRYRPSMCFVICRVGHNERNKLAGLKRPTYTICVAHGNGGGMYIGSSANKSERFGTTTDADVLITGHTHKPLAFPAARLSIDYRNKQIIRKTFWVVNCSSWLDYGGYPLEKMLPPTAFARIEIELPPVKGEIDVHMRG